MQPDVLTRAGLNLIQQALSIFDSDLQLVHANRPMQMMFDLPDRFTSQGTSFEELIRYLVLRGEYGPVDDVEDFVSARVTLARTFEPHYMERTRANGRTISVEGAPLPQGGWIAVYTDITDVKAQEALLRARSEVLSDEVLARSEELARANRQLAATNAALETARDQMAEMEARTRLTAEMMPAHIAHVDAAGRYTYSNRQLNAVIPGRPSDIVGLHIRDALGETYPKIQVHLDRAYAGTQSTVEFTDDNSARRIRAMFTPDAQSRGAYILSVDVTEETQARVALQHTRRREIAAQVTSGLAHDFSNLLTVILGLQARLAAMDLGDDARELIHATRAAASRGGTLLHRIADMTGARGYHPAPTGLRDILYQLQILARPSLPDGINLSVHCDVADPVLLDAGLVQDSVLNLVLNARDSCGHQGKIEVHAREVQGIWIDIAVSDNGPGFSPEALEHATTPFFTTKGGAGSGLGLAMVYDSCKLAGGRLSLSNQAVGAMVTLRLPLRRVAKVPDRAMVLLVEDDADLRDSVRAMLTRMGHQVVEAASVDEARDLATHVPDISLVLSDIMLLGRETGVDLVRHLANHDVRLMTSLPAQDPMAQAAAKVAPVLRKPFDEAQLRRFLSPSATGADSYADPVL